MKSPTKGINIVYVGLLLLMSLHLLYCNPFENIIKSFVDDDEITTITTDNETQLIEAVEYLNENGGTIYIDTPVININGGISLTVSKNYPGGIIGIRQENGEYPRINFVLSEEVEDSGIFIYGSNKFIEYIIVENSINNGITVMGDNNIFDHVISRYNYCSGFLVYGDFNTFNYCYSYRNSDISPIGPNSDGFRVAGESNNVFHYCFAWDNKNNGFNYDRIYNSSDLSYIHSGSWNNGNVDVFTGRYDYEKGRPLDKKLLTIQEIIKSDPNYVSNYYNKNFKIDEKVKIGYFEIEEWISFLHSTMNGNGFIFGNLNSSQSIDVKRNSNFNVAFDHGSGGFVDNYNHKYNAFFTDCVSFNNGINYKFPYYTLSKWSNNWSWNSRNQEQLNNDPELKKPRNKNSAHRAFYSIRDQIENAVFANLFPDNINFDLAIKNLRD